jgi:hypothetical protein
LAALKPKALCVQQRAFFIDQYAVPKVKEAEAVNIKGPPLHFVVCHWVVLSPDVRGKPFRMHVAFLKYQLSHE